MKHHGNEVWIGPEHYQPKQKNKQVSQPRKNEAIKKGQYLKLSFRLLHAVTKVYSRLYNQAT